MSNMNPLDRGPRPENDPIPSSTRSRSDLNLTPEQVSAADTSKQLFSGLVASLTLNARHHIPARFSGFGDEYFKEGYALEDGKTVWVERFPPRTRETRIEAAKVYHPEWTNQKAVQHAESGWYQGKPFKGDGFITALVQVEKGETVETFRLYMSGKFCREYFPGHTAEGKAIIDSFADLGADDLAEALKSDAPVTANPSIRKYLDYIDALDATASDLDEAGFNIATEAEAKRINALLSYLDGAKAAHRLGDFEFYQRI